MREHKLANTDEWNDDWARATYNLAPGEEVSVSQVVQARAQYKSNSDEFRKLYRKWCEAGPS